MEMIGRALLGSGANWSMASTRPAADPIPASPVMYEGSIDASEKHVNVLKAKWANPKWMKPTTSSFTEDLCSRHGSEGALCLVPLCRGCA